MDRIKLQQLAEVRLKDAEVLLTAGQWEAAYYLLGYCIECALKACVAKQFRSTENWSIRSTHIALKNYLRLRV